MKRYALFVIRSALPTSLGVLLAACTVGSGQIATESREVRGFNEIEVQGSGDVVVEVTGTESLEIEAEDNILPLLTSEVVDGRLELRSTGSFTTTERIRYTITATDLVGVSIAGSGDVLASSISSLSFEVSIDGSGSVELVGTADDLVIDINGSGDFDGIALQVSRATVSISGSGDVVVNAADELTVRINGSGDVKYIGNPTLNQSISGSGDVSQR